MMPRDKTKQSRNSNKKFDFRNRKRVCKFCKDKDFVMDYKEPKSLYGFITERGKIVPRRVTGTCAKHQRIVTNTIKRARILAFIPFTATHSTSSIG